MSKFFIYALHHDDSNRVYVGKTSGGLTRPRSHGNSSSLKEHAHTPIARWIEKLRRSGNDYRITILEVFTSSVPLNEAECFYIAYFRSIGMRLLNCTDGGEGAVGHRASLAARAKMSLARKGRPKSDEHRLKQRIAHTGKKFSLKHRENMSISRKGNTNSPAAREKMSIAHKGKKFSIQHRAALSGEHHHAAKLTAEQVSQIRILLSQSVPGSTIARQFSASKYVISRIKTGKCYSDALPDDAK